MAVRNERVSGGRNTERREVEVEESRKRGTSRKGVGGALGDAHESGTKQVAARLAGSEENRAGGSKLTKGVAPAKNASAGRSSNIGVLGIASRFNSHDQWDEIRAMQSKLGATVDSPPPQLAAEAKALGVSFKNAAVRERIYALAEEALMRRYYTVAYSKNQVATADAGSVYFQAWQPYAPGRSTGHLSETPRDLPLASHRQNWLINTAALTRQAVWLVAAMQRLGPKREDIHPVILDAHAGIASQFVPVIQLEGAAQKLRPQVEAAMREVESGG
jgi:hypothetical protein